MKDFATALFGDGLLENMRGQIKNGIQIDFVNQFTLFSVVGLLSAISPELITTIADKAFQSTKMKYKKEIDDVLMDADDFEAIFSEVKTETMALFEKVQTLISAHIAEV